MDSMSVALSEKTSTLDQLDIAHRTVQGQLERKTSEHDNLSLQNDEVCEFSDSRCTVHYYICTTSYIRKLHNVNKKSQNNIDGPFSHSWSQNYHEHYYVFDSTPER